MHGRRRNKRATHRCRTKREGLRPFPVNILLHTIALEPARWTPQRVSRPLSEILPTIAGAGFYKLEVFEPHLSLLPDEAAMIPLFERLHLVPMVLSSYLELSPHKNPDASFRQQSDDLLARVDRFGFSKVRLFPGESPDPTKVTATIQEIGRRLHALADQRPEVQFLLETHDGSLADEPACMVALVEASAAANVGLLWQPTDFEPAAARAQWDLQKTCVRHIHLQNRTADGRFCRLEEGVIPWAEILRTARFEVDVSLEFVPSGICTVEKFELTTSVQEAVEEFGFVVKLES